MKSPLAWAEDTPQAVIKEAADTPKLPVRPENEFPLIIPDIRGHHFDSRFSILGSHLDSYN
jgi:hypothetical protein